MSANATAALTIKLNVLGEGQLKALATQLGQLSATARKAAGPGLGRLATGVARAGTGAASARGKFRTLEQELERLQRRTDQERITAKARLILSGPPGTPPIIKKLRSVEHEMSRIQRLTENRAITAQARQKLGQGPSLLTGHGFVNRSRQTIGLMRDMTIAGMGVRFAMQSAAAGVGALIGPMVTFDQQLARVKVKGGFTDAQIRSIGEAAKVSGKTGGQFGAIEGVGGAIELAASGLSAKSIEAQIPTVLKFAQSGELSTEGASTVLVETMAQFFGPGQSAKFERIGNVMKQAADISTISVNDLAESFSFVGPIARSAGIELEQSAAIMAILGERGIKASMAGTAFRRMIKSLVDPSGRAKGALQQLGISKKEAQAGLQDLPGFLTKLEGKLAGKGRSKRLELLSSIFGVRGLAAAEVLMKSATNLGEDGRTELQKYTDAVTNSTGAMDTAAKILGGTFAGKMKKFKAAAEVARIELGGKLLPVLSELLPKLTNAATSTGEWISRNEDLVANLAIAVPSIGATALAVNGLAAAAAGITNISAKLGVKSLGATVGTAWGQSVLGTMLPVIAAGLAGFALGTLIAKAIDAEALGAKLFEVLHGIEPERGPRQQTIKQAISERAQEGAAAPETDPVLRSIQERESRVPAALSSEAFAPAPPPTGKIEIEITRTGELVVTNLESENVDLAVGLNVAP